MGDSKGCEWSSGIWSCSRTKNCHCCFESMPKSKWLCFSSPSPWSPEGTQLCNVCVLDWDIICNQIFLSMRFFSVLLLNAIDVCCGSVYIVEVRWRSDFTIRPKPNSWLSSPNFSRILSLVRKILVFDFAESFFDFYVQEVARLTSIAAGSDTDYRLQSVYYNNLSGTGNLDWNVAAQIHNIHYTIVQFWHLISASMERRSNGCTRSSRIVHSILLLVPNDLRLQPYQLGFHKVPYWAHYCSQN